MFEIKSAIPLRLMQTLTRMENTLATATERLEHMRPIYNELQSQVTNRCIAYEFIFRHIEFTGNTHPCASFFGLSDYFTCPNILLPVTASKIAFIIVVLPPFN